MLLTEQIFQNVFVEQIELRLIAKEAGFVDRQVFEQARQLFFSLVADQQAVVAVERIELAFLQAALQTVFQKMGAAFIEVHAAFLVDQGLQKFELRLRKLHRHAGGGHEAFAIPS